jgi:hypothetical protein
MQRQSIAALAVSLCLAPLLLLAQQPERVDLNAIHRIRGEAIGRNSKVMDTMWNLTDKYGPRLTNSPQFRRAGDWAVSQLKEWGLSNVHLEKWGPFGPGWEYLSYSGNMIEPTGYTLIGTPVAWTNGTDGPVAADAILAVVQGPADLDKYHGKLQGKIVLMSQPRDLEFPATALGHRYTLDELTALSMEQFPIGGGRGGRGGRGGLNSPLANMTPEQRQAYTTRLRNFWKEEKPAVVVQISGAHDSGTILGGGADRNATDNPPQVVIAAEQYNRIARILEHNVPVKLQFDIKTKFYPENKDSFNVIAEIPGATKPNELVMVGGHFDSWHYATGATDNAAGSAVAMEVMRILKSLNLKMDRTVRMALWGGEEQGLLGSRAYVKEHFADPEVMKPTAEHENFAGYFNIDNGTGKIRGVYLQGNDMMRPIFEEWFKPFKDMTDGVITIRNTGGTDHLSFDAVGLPGFQFIQDPVDYESRTHHTNMDTYDRIQAADMEQMAAIEAAFVYNAATRPDKLPRKPLPPPQPAGRGGRGRGSAGGN